MVDYDSDSDDDDLLLSGASTFARNGSSAHNRSAAARKTKQADYFGLLDEGLQEAKERRALQSTVAKLKQEQAQENGSGHDCCNDEERLALAETIAKEHAVASSSSKKKKQHDETCDIVNKQGNVNNAPCSTARKTTRTSGKRSGSATASSTPRYEGLQALALRDQLTTALDTAQTTTLGTRSVLQGRSPLLTFGESEGNHEQNQQQQQQLTYNGGWSTLDHCLDDLKDICRQLMKPPTRTATSKSSARMKQQSSLSFSDKDKQFRNAIGSLLQTCLQQKGKPTAYTKTTTTLLMQQHLLRRTLVKLCRAHDMQWLPTNVMEWLYLLACNPPPPVPNNSSSSTATTAFSTCGLECSRGAHQTLQTLFARAAAATAVGSENCLGAAAAAAAPPALPLVLTLSDLVRDLNAWYGLLRWNDDSGRQHHTEVTTLACKSSSSSSTPVVVDVSPMSSISVTGLEHFLSLWQGALDNDLVMTPCQQQEKDGNGACNNEKSAAASAAQAATRCMSALALVGLDPCVCTCPGLRASLLRTISTLLSFVARNIVLSHTTDGKSNEELSDWIQVTASAILDQCKNLDASTRLDDTNEQQRRHYAAASSEEDHQVWLCLSRMARTVAAFDKCLHNSVHDQEQGIHREFRVVIVMQALQRCLQVETSKAWTEKLQSMAFAKGKLLAAAGAANSESLPWHVIASSHVGLLMIPDLDIAKNSQQCLAAVEMIGQCALAGIGIHQGHINPQEPDVTSTFGTSDDAALMLSVLDELIKQSKHVASRLARLSSDPNMSRAECILSSLRRFFDHAIVKARACSGQAGPTVSVQKSIQNFFGGSQGSDDMTEV